MNNKKITREELDEVLRKHKLWLIGDPEGERANLYGADLCEANLREANLREANLSGANLCEANLYGANLYGANLYGANLRGANLRGANLCGANLYGANLYGANLYGANLRGANLRGANLRGANLRGANLRGANLCEADLYGADLRVANLCEANLYMANLCEANLCGADLCGADLYMANLCGADLCGADLTNVKNLNHPLVCPEKGSFIGFKKVCDPKNFDEYIVELEIMEDARRSSATGRKCRCDKAKVLSITNLDGTDAGMSSACSAYNHSFVYTVGEIVEEPNFDPNRWCECAPGIHFFITRKEAEDYWL